jgi:hypothetical protein
LGFETGIAVIICRKLRGLTCHFETEAGQPAAKFRIRRLS